MNCSSALLKVFVSLFGLILNVPVNSYVHVGTVGSPNHTVFLDKLDKTVNQFFVHILTFVTAKQPILNQRTEGEWPHRLFNNQSSRKYETWLASNLRYTAL